MPQAAVVLIGWCAAASGPPKAPVHEVADNYFAGRFAIRTAPWRHARGDGGFKHSGSRLNGCSRHCRNATRFARGCKSLTNS
jgi:hypothetical protein